MVECAWCGHEIILESRKSWSSTELYVDWVQKVCHPLCGSRLIEAKVSIETAQAQCVAKQYYIPFRITFPNTCVILERTKTKLTMVVGPTSITSELIRRMEFVLIENYPFYFELQIPFVTFPAVKLLNIADVFPNNTVFEFQLGWPSRENAWFYEANSGGTNRKWRKQNTTLEPLYHRLIVDKLSAE